MRQSRPTVSSDPPLTRRARGGRYDNAQHFQLRSPRISRAIFNLKPDPPRSEDARPGALWPSKGGSGIVQAMIVLFTDFGLEGPYTGQMTAVLQQTAPAVPVV